MLELDHWARSRYRFPNQQGAIHTGYGLGAKVRKNRPQAGPSGLSRKAIHATPKDLAVILPWW